MTKIAFVVLHYGDIKITDQCIESILKLEQQNYIKVIIVDNEDTDEQEIDKKWKQYRTNDNVIIQKADKKMGFSKANNMGYQYAIKWLKPEFIVICNNDITFVQTEFLSLLEKIYIENPFEVMGPDIIKISTGEHQNPMAFCPRTIKEVNRTIWNNRIGLILYPILYPILLRQRRYEIETQKKNKLSQARGYEEIQKNIIPFGACLIFSDKFLKNEKKAFTPETEFYYEEYILAQKCKKKSYQILYHPDLKVLHESGAASEDSIQNQKKRIKRQMYYILESCKIYKELLR